MTIDSIWPSERDEANFHNLITSIRSGKCSAFIGSGLSQNAKYPSWRNLLEELSQFVHERTGIHFQQSEDFYEWAEMCKAQLQEDDYVEFFVQQFGENADRLQTDTTYLDLDLIPFASLVTTNYDTCLLHATRRNNTNKQVHAYPLLDAGYLHSSEPSHIFHIHGLIHPDDPEGYVQTVVFTKSDYFRAYKERPELLSFLYQLVKNHDLLFVGFGLEDPFLMDQVKRTWDAHVDQSMELRSAGFKIPERTHFVLLPKARRVQLPELSEPSFIDDPQTVEDILYEPYGIKVIRYRPVNGVHSGLARIIETIRDETSEASLGRFPTVMGLSFDPEIG